LIVGKSGTGSLGEREMNDEAQGSAPPSDEDANLNEVVDEREVSIRKLGYN
jgi:hypothetical protein